MIHTEREKVHALLASHILAREAGWDRLAALSTEDVQAEQAAHRIQDYYIRKVDYWRTDLREKPFQVVMEP